MTSVTAERLRGDRVEPLSVENSPEQTPESALNGAEPPTTMVERMTLILDAFQGRTAALTLEEVAQYTRLPRSTAHRILDQLVKLSWLNHSGLGYSLGRRAREIGGDDRGHGQLRTAAAPLLHALLLKTGTTVHLAVLDEGRVRYLDKLGGTHACEVPSRVGGYAPVASTALGRSMLCWLPPEEVEDLVSGPLAREAPGSAEIGVLHQQLNRIRAQHGITFESAEGTLGQASVAVAVRGPEGPVASISLVGQTTTGLERAAPLVADVARRVSGELFPGFLASRAARRPGRHLR